MRWQAVLLAATLAGAASCEYDQDRVLRRQEVRESQRESLARQRAARAAPSVVRPAAPAQAVPPQAPLFVIRDEERRAQAPSGPAGMSARDAVLLERVRESLAMDFQLAPSLDTIQLYVQDGVVYLDGWAASAEQKERIELRAAELTGWDNVESRIGVPAPQGE